MIDTRVDACVTVIISLFLQFSLRPLGKRLQILHSLQKLWQITSVTMKVCGEMSIVLYCILSPNIKQHGTVQK